MADAEPSKSGGSLNRMVIWRGLDAWRSEAVALRLDRKGGQEGQAARPRGEMASVRGALDIDLGLSPLTDLMPIRRSGPNRRTGGEDFLMAWISWISVPDLQVIASGERYEHVRSDQDGSVVRYVDRGLFPGYKANLKLDRSGLVLVYRGLGKRVESKARA